MCALQLSEINIYYLYYFKVFPKTEATTFAFSSVLILLLCVYTDGLRRVDLDLMRQTQ